MDGRAHDFHHLGELLADNDYIGQFPDIWMTSNKTPPSSGRDLGSSAVGEASGHGPPPPHASGGRGRRPTVNLVFRNFDELAPLRPQLAYCKSLLLTVGGFPDATNQLVGIVVVKRTSGISHPTGHPANQVSNQC